MAEVLRKPRPRKGRTATPSVVDVTIEDEQNCTSVFHDAMRLHARLQQIAGATASALGVKTTEMSIVDTLGKFGPLTMGRLAELSFISPTNSTRAVKNLIVNELVERRRSEHSDREVVVRLTAKGSEMFEKSYPQVIHNVNEFLSCGLDDSDRATLAKLLERVIRKSGD